MPHESAHKELMNIVDQAELALAKPQYQDILDDWSDFGNDSSSGNSLSTTTSNDNSTINLSFSSPSPSSPLFPMTVTSGSSGNSSISSDDVALPYDRLLHTINALCDEVKRACVLHKPNEPPP
ncbi:uncharacterized protein BJ212DRAFT_1486130 [Suillus subaureus]|uniref:Uncharacterized protein n=1 Tax=Suillus subaureus TaxID=48587 RepID=A0A9P7DXZ6_9AGAM|nr:uncharacterized protein BJ212DRAFT_1486130 [Suillus subaureus]KAG1806004.1 hypothetical protein BJ212DRAFT_1486130 [Suillus subaureus]